MREREWPSGSTDDRHDHLRVPDAGSTGRDFPWAWVWLALGAAVVAATAVTVVVWGATASAHSAAFDAGIKVGGAVLAVLATVVAVHRLRLGLARQRVAEAEQRQRELEHAHRVGVDEDARREAAQRRITELLADAGRLLGSEKATTRITGLLTLERLGQESASHRQTVVDVVCAYLQMPFDAPRIKQRITVFASGPALDEPDHQDHDLGAADGPVDREARHELRVRLTAQRILTSHLRQPGIADGSTERFWSDIALNLSGATLIEFRLSRCRLDDADFTDAQFVGLTNFAHTEFTGVAQFTGTQFTGPASFSDAHFSYDAFLDAVVFTGYAGACAATFARARFDRGAWFTDTEFRDLADFCGTIFLGSTTLVGATFHDRIALDGAYAAEKQVSWPPGWRAEDHRSGPNDLYTLVHSPLPDP